MKYIIMADGEGKRWGNYKGVPKHLITVEGETILERTIRLLIGRGIADKDIWVTSSDPRYKKIWNNIIPQSIKDCELERFEESLVDGPVCYLYGDVYYTEAAMRTIIETETDDILFFGSDWEIFAIKVKATDKFLNEKHKVKEKYMTGELNRCIGWEIYRSLHGLLMEDEYDFDHHRITDDYVKILDETCDFDYPTEYEEWLVNNGKKSV